METIKYYTENDRDCYLLLLDASKAFDRVEYIKQYYIILLFFAIEGCAL